MRILALIAPATWPAVITALGRHGDGHQIHLVATATPAAPVVSPFTALMGRGRPTADRLPDETEDTVRSLLAQAEEALGGPCTSTVLHGHPERAVAESTADADWLILARDGDQTRLGPASLGRDTRFIVDHAPCTVELIWPDAVPDITTIPAPPR
ncbi:MAG: universal stress protein [Propionibacteriaceae bacterium]|nr:universal stress protein [Propionibacteriaceae bacterium]